MFGIKLYKSKNNKKNHKNVEIALKKVVAA